MLAFFRAQQRSSADSGHNGGAPSGSNTVNHVSSTLPQQTSTQDAGRGIRRQQSVRFVGPNGLEGRESIAMRATHRPIQRQLSSATLRPIAMTTNTPVPAAYRPPSRSSSIGKASVSQIAESLVAANVFKQYCTHEDDVASTPSSYRRIRRSKSMFSPLRAPSIFYTNGSPDEPESFSIGGHNTKSRSHTPTAQHEQPVMRAPKSMNFLRGHRQTSNPRNDAAVQEARDKFFRDTHQQRLREQPSFLSRYKAQKQEKRFTKSGGSSSSNSYGIPSSSPDSNGQAKKSGLRIAARKASKSIKNKFKRVLGRNKEPAIIPNQQVDARETHVRHYNGDSKPAPEPELFEGFSDMPHPDTASLSHVASRLPSLHTTVSSQQLRSHAGSVKSFTSDQSEDKSRATNGNTSVNTVHSQAAKTPVARDHQRLSVINEVGTHVPSSSFDRPKYMYMNQCSAYPRLHIPEGSRIPPPPPLSADIPKFADPLRSPASKDHAKLAEGLMQKLNATRPEVVREKKGRRSEESQASARRSFEEYLKAVENGSQERLKVSGKISEDNMFKKASKATGQHLERIESSRQYSNSATSSRENCTPPTIRCVPPSISSRGQGSNSSFNQWSAPDSMHSSSDKVVAHKRALRDISNKSTGQLQGLAADDVFSPKERYNNKENIAITDQLARNALQRSPERHSFEGNTQAYLDLPDSPDGKSPQEIAIRNEPFVPGTKVVRDARSTFFGGSTYTIPRIASPFRRAMAEVGQNSNTNSTETPLSGVLPPLKNPLFLGPLHELAMGCSVQARCASGAYSASIYSRTTGGHTIPAANSVTSLPLTTTEVPEMPLHPTMPGDAVIIESAVYQPRKPSDSGHGVPGSGSSQEWKNWMSSEVSKLERAKESTGTSTYINYALPTMPKSFHAGHVREVAQINSDDVEVTQRKEAVAKQPLGLIQQQNPNIQNQPLKPILKKTSTVSFVENTEPRDAFGIPIAPPLPPPIPPRSPLRNKNNQSKASVNTTTPGQTQSAPNSPSKIPSLRGRNVLHKRNTSQATLRSVGSASVKSVETPTKPVKRCCHACSNASTPTRRGGLAVTAEKQVSFTSTNSKDRITGNVTGTENIRTENSRTKNQQKEYKHDTYGTDGAGVLGQKVIAGEADVQASGGKKMVEWFLSTRRKRIASESDDMSSGAFL
ncbi:hypothetical protein EG329_000010 [Mollisiaceae sp. DMI_Dod_QoI]|nr:hypothetical protein EG329_000010 [Helotiales sp. DMI_Dod_QoI]